MTGLLADFFFFLSEFEKDSLLGTKILRIEAWLHCSGAKA